jgi:hypothetical protein
MIQVAVSAIWAHKSGASALQVSSKQAWNLWLATYLSDSKGYKRNVFLLTHNVGEIPNLFKCL